MPSKPLALSERLARRALIGFMSKRADCELLDEIEAEVRPLVEALEPFGVMAEAINELGHEDNSTCEWKVQASHVRAALAALKRAKGESA